MNRPKDDEFSEHAVEHGVELFAALAHPLRLKVLLELRKHGRLSVSDLTAKFKVEQSSMSHQLAILKRVNLLISTVEGRNRIYEITDEHVSHIVGDALAHVSEHHS